MDNLQVATTSNTSPKYIPIDSLISLSEQGKTNTQIAKELGCDISNITHRFNHYGYTPNRRKSLTGTKAVVLDLIQAKFINSIKTEEIEKAPIQTKIWSIGVLQDKIDNLERKQLAQTIEDTSLDDLSSQLSRIAARSPIVINNILNVVGSLPADLRDRIGQMIPQSLSTTEIIDCDVSG